MKRIVVLGSKDDTRIKSAIDKIENLDDCDIDYVNDTSLLGFNNEDVKQRLNMLADEYTLTTSNPHRFKAPITRTERRKAKRKKVKHKYRYGKQ